LKHVQSELKLTKRGLSRPKKVQRRLTPSPIYVEYMLHSYLMFGFELYTNDNIKYVVLRT
jgi:hypothetical protein